MPIPFWAGHYIGLPFLDHGRDRMGLDCWGLVRLVMAEQFGIALPSYTHEYQRTTQIEKIAELIDRESKKWKTVQPGNEICGDAAILLIRGKPSHVGMVMGDSTMLHIEFGINSCLENYSNNRWDGRVSGFLRYKGMNDIEI